MKSIYNFIVFAYILHFLHIEVAMLNYVWSFIVVLSVICSIILGNSNDLSTAFIDSAASAIELIITLAGVICLWSGIMRIASKSGLTEIFAKLFSPLLNPLFPRLDKKGEAFKCITMNLTANLLGLGNTATPLGLRAMGELQQLNDHGTTASDEMVIFVVMNTASLQLLPTMLATLRQSYGSSAPFEIIAPVWISSGCALAVALIIACFGNKLSKHRIR